MLSLISRCELHINFLTSTSKLNLDSRVTAPQPLKGFSSNFQEIFPYDTIVSIDNLNFLTHYLTYVS